MPAARRAPVVALLTLLQRRFPGLDDPARLIKEGAVLVNGVPAASPRTRVRADAAIRIRHPRPLRGTIKLAHALAAFAIDAADAVALDLGAAAISEPADLITMDLSYLAIADAIGQLDPQILAPAAQLIALVKPTFELHAATLADQPQQVAAAAETAARALEDHGWRILGQQPSPILGAKGAVEILLHAASGLPNSAVAQRRTEKRPSRRLPRWEPLAVHASILLSWAKRGSSSCSTLASSGLTITLRRSLGSGTRSSKPRFAASPTRSRYCPLYHRTGATARRNRRHRRLRQPRPDQD
jgi:23S rRNA (cytidine1920-2'-O)/16S rRNA (cytidine1409-2'-O)-methyltransferase